jgi:hypothetical protein
MESILKVVALSLAVALSACWFTGCGSSKTTSDKMGMVDRMGGDKMGMESPMNKAMEPSKMRDKMASDKMGSDKMGSDKMGSK